MACVVEQHCPQQFITVNAPSTWLTAGSEVDPQLLASLAAPTFFSQHGLVSPPIGKKYYCWEAKVRGISMTIRVVPGTTVFVALEENPKQWVELSTLEEVFSKEAFADIRREIMTKLGCIHTGQPLDLNGFVRVRADVFPFRVNRTLTMREFAELYYLVMRGTIQPTPIGAQFI